MTILGAVCVPQLPPERLRDVARAAEDSGLEELWLWEDCFWGGGVATAAAALGCTTRLRNPALAAMEIAALHRLFPDRVTIGVGHGVQDWMAQVGARADSPLTLLREQLTALRALLRGEQLSVAGRYVRLDAVRLDWPPLSPPTLYAGATGPRTLRLSGEVADGTILTASTSPDGVRRARELIEQGRAEGGRAEPHPVVVYLAAATGPNAAERLAAETRSWRPDPGPEVGAAGDAQAIADAVRRYADAGADHVVLQPTADEPDPEGFVRFTAEQVRPLLA